MAPAVDPELNKIPFGTPILHAPAQLNEALEAAAPVYVIFVAVTPEPSKTLLTNCVGVRVPFVVNWLNPGIVKHARNRQIITFFIFCKV